MAEPKKRKGVTLGKPTSIPVLDEAEHAPGGERWRETSAALYGRLKGSVADTLRVLRDAYPKKWQDYSPRPTAYVSWLARQTCDLYPRSPQVTYTNPETGKPHDEATVALIMQHRLEAGVEAALQGAHEESAATGNGVVWVIPAVRRLEDGSTLLGVRCLVVPAHHQAVTLADHPESTDECDVTEWRLLMPTPGLLGRKGVARITATEALWESSDGLTGQPVWHRADPEQASNPIGEIPAVALRWQTPEPGGFWSAAREDVLWTARALDCAYTDQGQVVRFQGFGQWWSKGLKQGAGEIEMGFGTMLELDDLPTSALGCESPDPDLAGSRDVLESYSRVAIASQDLNPASLLRSTAITAEGKKIELSDREALRQRHIPQLVRAEQRIYDLMRKWLRALRGTEVLPPAVLSVSYTTPALPSDPLHELQSMEKRMQFGQTNPYTEYARANNVSLEEARKAVDENFAVTKSLGVVFGTGEASPSASASSGEKPPALEAATPEVQKSALNGAQVDALKGIVSDVAQGLMPASSARAILLSSFPLDAAVVDAMLSGLNGFEPRAEVTP